MEHNFSSAAKELFAKAQVVAAELHYNDVNSYILFLAQCQLDGRQLSAGSIVYKDDVEFQRFYTAQRLMLQYHFPDYKPFSPLPFAHELNKLIHQSSIAMEKWGQDTIQPAHLFLAAAADAESLLYKVVQPGDQFYAQLLAYYQSTGIIPGKSPVDPEPVKQKGWLSRLFSMPSDSGHSVSGLPLNISLLKGWNDHPVSRYETDTDFDKTEVEVAAISHSKEQPGTYAIIFKEKEGERVVPVIVGGYEAEQLYIAIEKPADHNSLVLGVLRQFIQKLNYQVKETVVYGRISGVFLTRIILSGEQGLLAVEARPSDAIALSEITATPFTFARSIFDKVAILPGATDAGTNDEIKPNEPEF